MLRKVIISSSTIKIINSMRCWHSFKYRDSGYRATQADAAISSFRPPLTAHAWVGAR
jgi:hypothetical protein